MKLEQRIFSFSRLGEILRSQLPDHLFKAMEEAETENPWFTPENVLLAIRYWGSSLNQSTLDRWLDPYRARIMAITEPKRVGVVMAGNIPMVGFHDMLSVLVTGHHLIARLSSQDSKLIPAIVEQLMSIDPEWKEFLTLTTSEIERPDAMIATGSNNTSRYFSYYFGKYPHIIRKNRTGVAVLDGYESVAELKEIASDIFSYFGLGCRNISKLYLPQGYDLKPLHEAFLQYQKIFHHPKYRNNIDYYKSICLVNRKRFLDGVFYLLMESDSTATPVAVLHYEYYKDIQQVSSALSRKEDEIQCIVVRDGLVATFKNSGMVSPGETQNPSLSDYADGVDTMKFLLEKI
ncbi:MAG: acyl-CoA reductase [Bacteroidales bacterium]|nr:acyl-CoA reductase [Bacteroidales bacterium]